MLESQARRSLNHPSSFGGLVVQTGRWIGFRTTALTYPRGPTQAQGPTKPLRSVLYIYIFLGFEQSLSTLLPMPKDSSLTNPWAGQPDSNRTQPDGHSSQDGHTNPGRHVVLFSGFTRLLLTIPPPVYGVDVTTFDTPGGDSPSRLTPTSAPRF